MTGPYSSALCPPFLRGHWSPPLKTPGQVFLGQFSLMSFSGCPLSSAQAPGAALGLASVKALTIHLAGAMVSLHSSLNPSTPSLLWSPRSFPMSV